MTEWLLFWNDQFTAFLSKLKWYEIEEYLKKRNSGVKLIVIIYYLILSLTYVLFSHKSMAKLKCNYLNIVNIEKSDWDFRVIDLDTDQDLRKVWRITINHKTDNTDIFYDG